jgi:integrase
MRHLCFAVADLHCFGAGARPPSLIAPRNARQARIASSAVLMGPWARRPDHRRGAGRRGVEAAKTLTSGLRSLLVFLHLSGRVPDALAGAVPSVAGWRPSSLPRALEPEHVARLLAGCDRGTAVGRRDYAIILLLARLGLRACEVATLRLDDVD